MFALFQNPHLFIILHSILISAAAYGYSRATQKNEKEHMKTFWKTLLISLVIGLVLTYFVYKKEQVSSEPFQTSPQITQPMSSGI